MHIDIPSMLSWLQAHPVILSALGYAAMALVSTMPIPGSVCDWKTLYTWFYDWAHALLPQQPKAKVPPAVPVQNV